MQRLHRELEPTSSDSLTCHRVRVPLPGSRRRDQADVNFDDKYGFRGQDRRVYYLSPWEFTKLWCLEELRPPTYYNYRGRTALTQWTREGVLYRAELAADQSRALAAPKPIQHYVVAENIALENYVPFPTVAATEFLRHRFIMRRNERPSVPRPSRTPLPHKSMSAEESCRILNVYLRPWTLVADHSTAHVLSLIHI